MNSNTNAEHDTFAPRSSWVDKVIFDFDKLRAIIITKAGQEYLVEGFTTEELRSFRFADSYGRWFHQHIRNRKTIQKILG